MNKQEDKMGKNKRYKISEFTQMWIDFHEYIKFPIGLFDKEGNEMWLSLNELKTINKIVTEEKASMKWVNYYEI